jgi:hypothetical protein
MLQKVSDDVALCHGRAEDNRRRAEVETDQKRKAQYLDLEARWLKLAASYEFTEQLNHFTAHVACRLDELRT